MSNVFYRYIRPHKFNEQRLELETVPRGGVCLRFEKHDADDTYWFTYARCHDDELFSKEVAKRIADHRAASAVKGQQVPFFGRIRKFALFMLMVNDVLDWCHDWHAPIDEKWMVRGLYLEHEFHELASALETIIAKNNQESMKADIWINGIEATKTKEQYERNYSAQAPGNSYD